MKKILIIAFLFIGLKGVGQIKLPAPVIRNSPTDSTYGTHYDSLSYKGFRTSSSITNRNAIPMALRGLGMVVNVVGDSSYTLKNGLSNSNWETYKPGSSNSLDTTKIPLGGTATGKEITGRLIFSSATNTTAIANIGGQMWLGAGNTSSNLPITSIKSYLQFIGSTTPSLKLGVQNTGSLSNLLFTADAANPAQILVTTNTNNPKGLIGFEDYNINNSTDSLLYVQQGYIKKFIRDSLAAIRSSIGGVHNLQQVTDLGNETTNSIIIGNVTSDYLGLGPTGLSIGFASGSSSLNRSDGVSVLKFPNSGPIEKYIPVSVNGVFAAADGNITIAGGGGGTVDTQYLRRDINLKFDSLRNNAGILEGRKNGVFIPQLVIPTSISIYTTNGTLTSPRRVNGNGYLLKFDSTKLSIADTSNIAGHLYDFNNGVSFVDYNSTNTSSLIQTEISGVKFSTNDRNNLDTSNYLWAKTDKVELFSTNRIDINSRTFYPATYTTAGTTGNQTINKNSGSVNIAPAITTITVTNNLVTANTIVTARVSSNDATAEILNVVSVTNGFIITMSTPATNETQIKFWITN